MAAYSDIIATLGGSTSNSYVTGVAADQFAALQAWNADWLGKTESERTVALLSAAKWLDTVDFAGDRCNPSTDDAALPQRRSWPRSGVTCDGITATCAFIPQAILDAQCLIAYHLVMDPTLIIGTPGGGGGAAAGTYVKRNKLGDLEQEFAEYSSSETASSNDCSSCDQPAIINALPWLKGVLACWASTISSTGGRVILRVRS